ncbi:hypothetical protein BJX64DRAFT_271220 [Aspergillus heterothallicus]
MVGSKLLAYIQNQTKQVERLDRWYNRWIKHKTAPAQQREYAEVTRLMRSLSENEAPSLAIGAFESQMLNKTFGVQEGSPDAAILDITPAEYICLPIPLESVLADFEQATRGSTQNETIVRGRLDLILYLTLADQQRSAFYGHKLISSRIVHHIEEVFWATEKQISQNITYNKARRNLNGFMDYSLWWGNAEDVETNMVVVEAEAKGAASLSREQALVSMCMIYAARKKAGKEDCRVFGIGTDSYEFHFIAIDNNGVWSWRHVRWYTTANKLEIISRIGKIIREAAKLVPTSNRSSTDTAASVMSQTGLIVRDIPMEEVDEEEVDEE